MTKEQNDELYNVQGADIFAKGYINEIMNGLFSVISAWKKVWTKNCQYKEISKKNKK